MFLSGSFPSLSGLSLCVACLCPSLASAQLFLGRPKSKANQNANTTRIPYGYTKQQKWSTFVTNGRPMFQKCCLLLCDVKFELGSCSFWEETHRLQPGEHAEVKALRHISTKEQQDDTVAR